MAGGIYLASTVVMGLLVAGVVMLMRARPWHHYSPQAAYGKLTAGGSQPTSALQRMLNRPGVWTAVFVVLALGLTAGATVYVGGGPSLSGPLLIGGLAALVVAYMAGGVYVALRGHGRPTAQAVAGSAATLGALFVLAIALKLVVLG